MEGVVLHEVLTCATVRHRMPNAEFLAPWYNERMPQSMPRWIYDTLSDHAKDTCRRIVQPVDAPHPVEAACKPAALPIFQPLRKAFVRGHHSCTSLVQKRRC